MTSNVLTWAHGPTPTAAPAAVRFGGRRQAVVTLTGELDVGAAFELRALLEDLAHRPPTIVVFDAAGVTFLDTTGLNALLVAAACLRAAGHEMSLRQPSLPVRRLLVSTGTASLVGLSQEALISSDPHHTSRPSPSLRTGSPEG